MATYKHCKSSLTHYQHITYTYTHKCLPLLASSVKDQVSGTRGRLIPSSGSNHHHRRFDITTFASNVFDITTFASNVISNSLQLWL